MQPSNSPAVQRHLHVTAVPVATAGSEVQIGRDSNLRLSGYGGSFARRSCFTKVQIFLKYVFIYSDIP